jgi:hypothetical protein|tara:strand:- start:63 stop:461 length:399 start_codon:yes stop_codon:yes gene_type:complete
LLKISEENQMKEEVIELEAIWYGGGFHFRLLGDKTGLVVDDFAADDNPSKIEDYKIIEFWKKVEELGVWKWYKKYPYWKQKYEPMLDGCDWKLKLRDRNGRAKYCAGYESFPRKFKKLIRELNNLFGSNIEF